MLDQIARRRMIWVNPPSRTARNLASSGPASVMVSMPKFSMFTAAGDS
jgi:hypothetical protein